MTSQPKGSARLLLGIAIYLIGMYAGIALVQLGKDLSVESIKITSPLGQEPPSVTTGPLGL